MDAFLTSAPDSEWIYIIRMILACLCGGAIGFERTKRLKEAGIRTHCIIAAASALLMIISKYGFTDLGMLNQELYPGTRGADAARIAAQVVSGISFLGAGVIFKNGNSVKGLTTAAGIWATAAVGLSIGCGMYLLGLVETAIVVVIQLVFHKFSIGNDAYSENDVRITALDSEAFRQSITNLMKEKHIQILNMKIDRQSDGTVLYSFSIRTRSDFTAIDAMAIFTDNPAILSISI